MRKGAGRAFLGFILTAMLTFVLIGTCFAICLKTTVFKGEGLKDLINNIDIGEVVEEIMIESANETLEQEKDELSSSASKFTETILNEDVISDVADIMVEGLTSDKEVDFSSVKEGCMNALTDMSEQTVEDVLNDIKNTSNVIDAETLKNNEIIKQYQEEFNIDITTPILEQMETVYGSKSVSLDDVDVEEVKSEAKEAINQKVMPDIEKKVDQFIEETNIEVNKELHSFRKDNDIESITDIFNPIFAVILRSIIIGSIIALVIIGIQMLIYKKDISRAVKNVGIASVFVTIAMIGLKFLCSFLANILKDMVEGDKAVVNALNTIIDSTIPKIGSAAGVVAIISGSLVVVLIIVSVILKKKFGANDEVRPTNTAYATANNAPSFNVVADQSSVNNMYGQQQMPNNMYNQQPVENNMYNQQPTNNTYVEQPQVDNNFNNNQF